MSKFFDERKKLLEDVFEKASNNTTEKSFSGILKYLEYSLWDDYKISLSYKTFETYYNTLVIQEKDYNIKPRILDELSVYLGYNNFKEYCAEWKTVEYSISERISKVVIQIINKPILSMPEFIKNNGLGIMEVFLLVCIVTGSVVFSNNPKKKYGFANLLPKPECMYWNGSEYKLVDCDDKNPLYDNKIPVDEVELEFFKRILRKDTLTFENAVGKTWYSKFNGNVEFFTKDGVDPDTGRELKKSTSLMIEKYAGNQENDSIE
ncbi:hypothetical protein [Chryseobacterium oryctis]|uniref:YARHG domain-containing protein n=1 Tax=Chryseobacterium oryctis TaxID=2952618 RepID=A0ABT3HLW4_9FLAO|nr:hypothetical protein [Chryseobacterium oryctis]MCW3160781.1 hypothetical protein [Chryseobacterium oryctis]